MHASTSTEHRHRHTVHRRCLLAAALLGCCCELLRTHEHLLLAVLLGWLFGLVE